MTCSNEAEQLLRFLEIIYASLTHFDCVFFTVATFKGGQVDFFKGESKLNVSLTLLKHCSGQAAKPQKTQKTTQLKVESTVLGKFEQFPLLRYAKGTLSVAESHSQTANPISYWSWSQSNLILVMEPVQSHTGHGASKTRIQKDSSITFSPTLGIQ